MKSSQQIKPIYEFSSKPENVSKNYRTTLQIQKTESVILSSNALQFPEQSHFLTTDNLQPSMISQNNKYAIDCIPNETVIKKSSFSKYFVQDDPKIMGKSNVRSINTSEKMGLSTLSKIFNPYIQERQNKQKTQLPETLKKLKSHKIRQAFNLIKKPFQYVNTIKKQPTFSNSQNQMIKNIKSMAVGKIVRQNTNNINFDVTHTKTAFQNPKNDQGQRLSDRILMSSIQPERKTYTFGQRQNMNTDPMINKLIICENPDLFQELYISKLNKQERSNLKQNLDTPSSRLSFFSQRKRIQN